ncbi:hypothetical protein [Nonomuraea sp. NPDC049750]
MSREPDPIELAALMAEDIAREVQEKKTGVPSIRPTGNKAKGGKSGKRR